jgi:hypothetical protein
VEPRSYLISIPEILDAIWAALMFLTAPLSAIPDRTLAYAAVVCCSVSVAVMAMYVRKKFRSADGALALLSTEWEAAESEFLRVADIAQRKIGSFSIESAGAAPSTAAPGSERPFPLTEARSDLPRQVAAMARRGLSSSEIGATLGLGEADVNVLFGMHRVTQRKK